MAERDTALLLQLLGQLKEYAPEKLSLSAAWNLYGALASSEAYGPIAALDDLYSPEQMVFKFGSFRNMIDTLCSRIQNAPSEAGPARLSNTAFLYMIKYIDQHLSEDCSLQQLSKEMNMTANYLGQVFKRETGKPYTQYLTELRIERAKEMLLSGDLSIGEIGTKLGFNDYFYFLKTFKRVTGVTPKQYRQDQSLGGGLLFTE
jgi:two-component system, response regulator YesN